MRYHWTLAWFVAAAPSLGGKCDLLPDLQAPAEPESIRGAKEWLSKRMNGRKYREGTANQFDPGQARACPSFHKLWREAVRIVAAAVQSGNPQ